MTPEEVPYMIESHQNHDDAANHVDRFDAGPLYIETASVMADIGVVV